MYALGGDSPLVQAAMDGLCATARTPEPLDPAVCRSIRDAQKLTPNRVWGFTKALQRDKLEVHGGGLCGASVVAQFQLFPAQGMLYSLALILSSAAEPLRQNGLANW
jgi:hypothetical protein